jgi:hypothetical protein
VLDVLLPPPLLAEQHPLQWLQPVDEMVVHVMEVAAASAELQHQTFSRLFWCLDLLRDVKQFCCELRAAAPADAQKSAAHAVQSCLPCCCLPSFLSTCRPHLEKRRHCCHCVLEPLTATVHLTHVMSLCV